MKKFFLMAVVCLSTVFANAQTEVGSLTLMPKVGLNLATVTEEGSDFRTGFVGGLEAEYQLSNKWSLSAAALFSMQGSKFEFEDEEFSASAKFNYLNIPVLANYQFAKGFKVKAGIQPAFLLSSKFEIAGENFDNDVKKFDVAIPVGVSYEFSNIVIDARYNIGLTGIATKEFEEDFESKSGSNAVFQLTVGYKFSL